METILVAELVAFLGVCLYWLVKFILLIPNIMLISLIILVLVGVVAYWIITKFLPEPIKTVALVVTGVVLLIWLLQIVGVVLPGKLI